MTEAITNWASDEIEKTKKQKRKRVAELDEKDEPETWKIKQKKLTNRVSLQRTEYQTE